VPLQFLRTETPLVKPRLLDADKGFYPAVIIVGSLTQPFFADSFDLVDVTEEVDDVLVAGEQGQMAEDDDTINSDIRGPASCQTALRMSPSVPSFDSCMETRSSDKEPTEIKISNILG
jgi:hypothetical protein